MRVPSTPTLTLATAFACLALAGPAHPETRSYITVAAENEPSPGTGGIPFSGFFTPVISGDGAIAFWGRVDGGLEGIWSTAGLGSSLTLAALENQSAPDSAGSFFRFVNTTVRVGSGGFVSFRGKLDSISGSDGIWGGMPGNLRKLVVVGDPAPGFVGRTTGFSIDWVANDAGTVIVSTDTAGLGVSLSNDAVIYSGTPGDLEILALETEPAPVPAGPGANYSVLLPTSISINSHGQFAFTGNVTGGGLGVVGKQYIFRGADVGSIEPMYETGETNPGLPGVELRMFTKVRINDTGRVFFSTADGNNPAAGISHLCVSGIEPYSDIEAFVSGDTSAPDSGGLMFDNLRGVMSPALGAGTNYAFESWLVGNGSGPFDTDSIWSTAGGTNLILIAKRGDPAPGFPAGITFTSLERPSTAANGVVAFFAKTSDGGEGIWIGGDGDLRAVVSTQDTLLINGQHREVQELEFRGGASPEDGVGCPMNNNGQLVFQAGLRAWGQAVMLVNDAFTPSPEPFDLSDADNDGVPCVVEDALGGDCNDSSDGPGGLIRIRQGPTANEVTVSFLRRQTTTLTYEVQINPGNAWSPAPGAPTVAIDQSGVPAGYARVEQTIEIDAPSKLIRIALSQ